MSCAIIDVIFGVPLNEEVAEKLHEWEHTEAVGPDGEYKWYETSDGECGFTKLYSAGDGYPGYCGVELCQLKSYQPQNYTELQFSPTPEQYIEALKKVEALPPELKELAGPIGTYFIWSDS